MTNLLSTLDKAISTTNYKFIKIINKNFAIALLSLTFLSGCSKGSPYGPCTEGPEISARNLFLIAADRYVKQNLRSSNKDELHYLSGEDIINKNENCCTSDMNPDIGENKFKLPMVNNLNIEILIKTKSIPRSEYNIYRTTFYRCPSFYEDGVSLISEKDTYIYKKYTKGWKLK